MDAAIRASGGAVMATVRGIILDVDGTLVNSNDAHARAWLEALAEHGIEVPADAVRRRIGMGGDKLLPAVAGETEDSPRGKAITSRRSELFMKKFLPTLEPTPGARELLHELHRRGLKLVVASSAKKDELRPLLEICGAARVIEDQTSSDDADHSKPDPDIVHAALQNLGMPAGAAIMLGDTPYDVEAAGKAGVGVIAFRSGGWEDAGLTGALAVYDDPGDLLAHIDTSPLAT
jgi:HAD superfamily hydrolase (TIGR01509 family)